MKKTALLNIILALALVACGSEKKPLPENASVYEKAVANSARPSDDIDSDESRRPAAVMAFTGTGEGMTVVDLLAGGGYYSELFSYVVGPTGKVYLQNNSMFLRSKEAAVVERLEQDRLPNVVRLDSEFADLKLPVDADLIVLGKVYHDIYVPRDNPVWAADRDSFFSQLKQSLKPGGKILVIDHAGAEGTGNSKTATHHRIDEEFARADFESEGFIFLGALDVLRNPDDDYNVDIWAGDVRGKTDRFIYLFQKAESTADNN